MTTAMTPTFVPYDPTIHQNLLNVQIEEIPKLKTAEINELVKILKEHSEEKVVKVRGLDGVVVNHIIDPHIANLFTRYYRSEPENSENPFGENKDFAAEYLLGKDSIMTCHGQECAKIRTMLIKFMRNIKSTDTLDVCQKVLNHITQQWLLNDGYPVKEKEINLHSEIPLLIANIGIEGIMKFPKDVIDATAKYMNIISTRLAEPHSNKILGESWLSKFIDKSGISKVVSTAVNSGLIAMKLFAAVKIKKLIRNEIAKQVRQKNITHSFLAEMKDYTRKKFENQKKNSCHRVSELIKKSCSFFASSLKKSSKLMKNLTQLTNLSSQVKVEDAERRVIANSNEWGEIDDRPISDQEIDMIAHNYSVILFAFQETTASILKHILLQLAKDSHLQNQMREISRNIQNKYSKGLAELKAKEEDLSREELVQLKQICFKEYFDELSLLDNLISESFRVYSPGEFTRHMKDLVIDYQGKQYVVLSGEIIDYTPFVAGKFTNDFKNPEKFDPSRFGGLPPDERRRLENLYLHFGGGKDACPGRSSALLQLKIILPFLLDRFEFTAPKTDVTFTKEHVITTKEDIKLIVKSAS